MMSPFLGEGKESVREETEVSLFHLVLEQFGSKSTEDTKGTINILKGTHIYSM